MPKYKARHITEEHVQAALAAKRIKLPDIGYVETMSVAEYRMVRAYDNLSKKFLQRTHTIHSQPPLVDAMITYRKLRAAGETDAEVLTSDAVLHGEISVEEFKINREAQRKAERIVEEQTKSLNEDNVLLEKALANL